LAIVLGLYIGFPRLTHVTGTRIPIVLSKVGDNEEPASLPTAGWNSIHSIVRRNVLIHNINGT
jgi:hypothetical protein